jgi:hypothetical protein
MKKTFKELVNEKFPYIFENVNEKDVIELMQQVRITTLQEAADNNDVDVQWMGWLAEKHIEKPFIPGEDYEVYVINSSILDLDKNSIEV